VANIIKNRKKVDYYWIPLIIVILIPIIINCIAVIEEVGIQVLRDSVVGEYLRFGLPYNPWPDIIPTFIFIAVSIALLSWAIVKTSSWLLIKKRSILLRYTIYFILAFIGSIIITYGMNIMALSWLGAFQDYQLGLPVSRFVINWSNKLGIPAETVLLYFTFIIKNK
jgi:hypothetical protein